MVQPEHGRSSTAAHELGEVAVQAFASALHGELIRPIDAAYALAQGWSPRLMYDSLLFALSGLNTVGLSSVQPVGRGRS